MFFNHSCYKTRLILLTVKNLIVDNISECNRVKMLRIIIRYAHLQCNDITSVTAAVLMSSLLSVREAVLRHSWQPVRGWFTWENVRNRQCLFCGIQMRDHSILTYAIHTASQASRVQFQGAMSASKTQCCILLSPQHARRPNGPRDILYPGGKALKPISKQYKQNYICSWQ